MRAKLKKEKTSIVKKGQLKRKESPRVDDETASIPLNARQCHFSQSLAIIDKGEVLRAMFERFNSEEIPKRHPVGENISTETQSPTDTLDEKIKNKNILEVMAKQFNSGKVSKTGAVTYEVKSIKKVSRGKLPKKRLTPKKP